MHNLVDSSQPGAVDRDRAIHLLTQRAVLTRSLCQELRDAASADFNGRRIGVALGLLLRWVSENMPESVRVEPHPSDGIDQMVVPEMCQELVQEIRDGAAVGEALFMLYTADTPTQAQGDKERITKHLESYWAKHAGPVYSPTIYEVLYPPQPKPA
ncbi:MAG: hypothetical protein ACKVP0_23450 [Pirellulaceae bacterium]